MQRRYRILKDPYGYYPQVRKWFVWRRIATHIDGFGLYHDLSHPYEDLMDAQDCVVRYSNWIKKIDDSHPEVVATYKL